MPDHDLEIRENGGKVFFLAFAGEHGLPQSAIFPLDRNFFSDLVRLNLLWLLVLDLWALYVMFRLFLSLPWQL